MNKKILILFLLLSITFTATAQDDSKGILNVDVDSLLARYHLLGIKIFVKKVGVFSLKDKTLSLKRSDFNDKLLITFSRSISLRENNYGARFDYKLSDYWILRGESYRRSWGQQSGINIIYQLEFN